MDAKTVLYPIKRLKQSRIECTITFEPGDVSHAEASALQQEQKHVTVKGFRPGHAPLEMVRADMGPERLLNETIRTLLPRTLRAVIQTHQLKPIIPPSVSVTALSPLTITLILVEHPTVKVNKIPPIDKKNIEVRDEDCQRIIDYTLKQYKQEELTDTFVQAKLGGTSVASFKEEVRKNLLSYEEQREARRREHALLDAIRDAVSDVDLAPELLSEEEQTLTQEFLADLKRANVLLDDWCKKMNKTRDDLAKELKKQAEHRLKIRFGIESLIKDRNIAVDEHRMEEAMHALLAELPEHQRKEQQPFYQKGEEGYERLKWKIQVSTLMNELLK